MVSNGVEVCSSCQEYLSHFVFLKDQCSSAKISPFIEDPIRTQDKVIIRYNAEIEEKSGEKSQLQIIAILTLREGKIAKWVEVLNKTAPIYWN